MTTFHIAATLVALAALGSFINYKLIRLPTTIGVMFIALVTSLLLVLLGGIAQGIRDRAADILTHVNFDAVVLHGMLAFLLFAGALHIDLNDLREEWLPITLLATVSTTVSALLVGFTAFYLLRWLGFDLPLIQCLLFGAIISPTDPIAVLGILKSAHAPKRLEIHMAAESLFNDGVGVVLFLVILGLAAGEAHPTFTGVAEVLGREVVGGAALGFALGVLAYQMLKRVDQYQVEVLLTIAVATGGYALAETLGVSAPITVVVAGLLVGNPGRAFGMSETTRRHLDNFWEMVDEILNAILFLLIGLQMLVMSLSMPLFWASLTLIPVALLARFLSVAGVIGSLRFRGSFDQGSIRVLTWGGLRGGISVALALSLPPSPYRNLIVPITYAVVVFSIIVQGLTIGKVVKMAARPSPLTPSVQA